MVTFAGTIRRTLVFALVLSACSTQLESQAAEMRTWTAASGGFTVEAELVLVKPGDVAQLKTKDGRTLDVPLAQLSAADQEYAKKQTTPAGPNATTPTAPVDYTTASAKFNDVQKQADRCRTPGEALILFKVFHDDAATTPADRALAAARIAEFKQLDAEKKVRLNKLWVSAAEADVVRKKADELMRQAMELWKLDQEDAAKKKFAEAANLEPEQIRAEFVLGLIYTLQRSAEKALPIFQRCLQRDPDNVAVLNNIALLSASRGDWVTMVSHWRKLLSKNPDQRVVHNVGRFLSQSVSANVPIPKAPRESLAGPYTELVASGKFKATNPEVGWLFLMIEESALDFSLKDDDENKAAEKKPVRPETNDDGVVVGGGTGFVVHPGYVMTNAHVAVDDAVFEIQTADGKRLRATRVSKAHDADLALLKCEELAAPPLILATDIAPRGTDIMLLGFPEMFSLGATLKATRGSISSIPDAQSDDAYLYDAVTNSGNSGGPVCDATGTVIAVHFAGVNTASRYGSGIASAKARAFLAAALPEAQTATASKDKLEWPAVDAKVSPSTVLIWVRKKNAVAAQSNVGSDVMELPICLFCGGARGIRCVAPGCAKMRVARGSSNCRTCGGRGVVECQVCEGLGVDAQLASVQEAVKAVIAAKNASNSNPANVAPSTTSSTSTATSATTGNAEVDWISSSSLQTNRKNAKPNDPRSLAEGRVGYPEFGYDFGELPTPTAQLSDVEMAQIINVLRGRDIPKINEAMKQLAVSVPLPAYRANVASLLETFTVNQPGRWVIKVNVSRALVTWGRLESRPLVRALLRDESWLVRQQASIALAQMGDTGGIPALVECMIRPSDFVGDHAPKAYSAQNDSGRFMRALIVLGEASIAELKRVRPSQNVKVQELIDFTIAACSEK